MAQEETILLHFDIDEQPAVNSIKDLRTANSQLRAERDKVNISTKEGAELVQKLNVAIDKNNKVIKDNSSALEKQRQNVGNYSKSIQEAAGNLNIMGTNVGGLGAKLASFANPATAAIGIVTALGAAYARSSIGAKDLEFASNQLNFALNIVTDSFAELFSSAEDGQGFFSKLTNSILASIDLPTATLSAAAAAAAQKLEQVQRDAILGQIAINERVQENLELKTLIADADSSIQQKQEAALKIQDNININTSERLEFINKEITAIQVLASTQKNKELFEFQINKLLAERSNIQKQETKEIEKVNKQLNGIINAEEKRLELIQKQNTEKRVSGVKGEGVALGPTGNFTTAGEQEIKLSREITGVVVDNNKAKQESYEDYFNRVMALQEMEAGAARDLAGTLSAIADEGTEAQKALALTSIAINSGIGVSEAVKAGAGIAWPGNLGAILSGITAVLAGIAQAKSLLGFAEGGWTGPGSKYKAVGVVHADEYVTPKRIVNSPAAQPHIAALERMRTGYADGGFVANSNMEASRQSQMLASAFKNMPPIIASWTEGRAVGRKVEFKERVTRQ